MNFELPDDILVLKRTIAEFVRNEVDPLAQEIEDKNEIPQKIIEMSKEIGLFGLSIPEEYGGLGMDMVGKCALFEELGKTHNGFTSLIGAHNGIGSVGIIEMGNEAQKRKYLPRMAAGEWIGAFALTEPNAGSEAYNIKTRAVRSGNKYLLNGSKVWITNGPIADVITAMAVTDPSKGPKGISSFIVEKGFPGFRVGKIDEKMGLHGSLTAELFFDDMEVPAENLLGKEGEGYVNALKILANGRAGLAARCLGSCEKLLEMSIRFASERIQFGKPIIEIQAIQHMLAEISMEIETLRSLLFRVAWMTDQRKNIMKEASIVKLYASEVYNRVADKALQIHGGSGYMREYEVERYYRDARITRIYEGTSEIQKNIIAAQLKKEFSI